MALLNFKYGLHKNLPTFSEATIGNVFVTTDEQAMHIDLPGGRVVISQIITLATAEEWQSMKPPYSTQAFYYIVDANALLKYTGNGTTHTWKQINSTADVQAEVNKLREDLGSKDSEGNWTSGLGLEVANHSTDIAAIKGEIGEQRKDDHTPATGLHGDIETLTNSLQGVANDVTAVETLVHSLENVVGYAGAFDTEDDAKVVVEDKEVCLIGNKLKLCSVDSEKNKSFVDYNTVVVEIELLKKTVKDLQDTTASNATIIDLQDRVKGLQDWKKDVIGAPAEGDTPASGIYILIENAQTQADTAKQIADQAVADAKKANDAIGVPSGGVGEDGNPIPASGLYAKIEKNETDIAEIENKIGEPAKDEETPATGLYGDIAALRDEVMEDIQTADAMVFKDVVGSEVELTSKEATAQIGHTYKASAEFEINDGEIKVHIGDLLIATGDEDEATGYITDVTWKHIPSGYIADYNPAIEVAEDEAGDNEVVLALSSGVAKDEALLANRGDLGKIKFATAEGSALTVSADAGKVTFSMVWESFDPVV